MDHEYVIWDESVEAYRNWGFAQLLLPPVSQGRLDFAAKFIFVVSIKWGKKIWNFISGKRKYEDWMNNRT